MVFYYHCYDIVITTIILPFLLLQIHSYTFQYHHSTFSHNALIITFKTIYLDFKTQYGVCFCYICQHQVIIY